jgi:hypothetical protein
MPDDLRERMLASYADLGEAMVVQNVLETGGVPCRVADLGNLPSHVVGMPGGMNRSMGLWVLEADVDRARELLATLGSTEHGVDEEALAAEALAAVAPEGHESGRLAPEPARGRPLAAERRPAPWLGRAVFALFVAMALAWLARGCA